MCTYQGLPLCVRKKDAFLGLCVRIEDKKHPILVPIQCYTCTHQGFRGTYRGFRGTYRGRKRRICVRIQDSPKHFFTSTTHW